MKYKVTVMDAYYGHYAYADDAPSVDPLAGGQPFAALRARPYRVFAILSSFLMLWLAPVAGGDAMVTRALLVSILICLWDPAACLFLMIASTGAYFSSAQEGGGFRLTPTQIVGFVLLLRCLVSPGFFGITTAFGRMDRSIKVFLGLYFVSLSLAGFFSGSVRTVFHMFTNGTTLVIAAALAWKIDDSRWTAIAVISGLFLIAAYYLLIWSGLLAPMLEARAITAGGTIMRASVGRTSLNYIGSLVAPCIVGLGCLYMLLQSKKASLFAVTLMVVAISASFSIGSRGAFVSAALGLVIVTVLAGKITRWQFGLRIIGLVVVGLIFVVLFWGAVGEQWRMMLGRFGSAEGVGRLDLWMRALIHVVSNPFPNPVRWYLSSHGQNPHQTFLMVGVEAGYGGFFGFIGLTFGTILCGWRRIRSAGRMVTVWDIILWVMLVTVTINICSSAMPGHKLLWCLVAVVGTSRKIWDTVPAGLEGYEPAYEQSIGNGVLPGGYGA